MSVTRIGLAIVLLAGCTKDAPPPQPPVDDAPPPESAEEPEQKEEVKIDPNTRIDGPLTEEQVDAVVQTNFNGVKGCFDAALVRMDAGDLTGAIAVRVEIDGSGKVTEASVDASNFGDEETPACIVSEVEGWSFPADGKGKPSTVVYPFFLRSY